ICPARFSPIFYRWGKVGGKLTQPLQLKGIPSENGWDKSGGRGKNCQALLPGFPHGEKKSPIPGKVFPGKT
ncbi:hypothetical protein, partial [Faecalibaculum rodentium]|uniref:hypothetical protein n=1 Tax=Faecalibaculum rodentium TaxID=1702221 RepID=UPI002608A6DF